MRRVLCDAIVDLVAGPKKNGENTFKVEVWGKEPHDFRRHYTIPAKSDNLAAQEGIRRFVEEMERMNLSVGN